MRRLLIGSFCALALVATGCSSDADDTAGTDSSADVVDTQTAVTDASTDTAPADTDGPTTEAPADTEPADTEPVVTETPEPGSGTSDARAIVEVLASDDMGGRDNLTDDSLAAQDYLFGQLAEFTEPAYEGTGIDGYLQEFVDGANMIGVIPGGDLAEEFVVIGAHYDHVGSECPTSDPADDICNGATDNAAGVAAALTAARAVAADGPRRTIIVALWDAEEDGLLGSAYYATDPLVPFESTVAYVNFDVIGADLLPSAANQTIAVGAETGGPTFVDAVTGASSMSSLDTAQLSVIFGQGRSDHVNFVANGVPSIFFTDATNACYHTAQDDVTTINFDKLDQQVITATALLDDLGSNDVVPVFDPAAPVATYDDAVALLAIATAAEPDFALLDPEGEAVSVQLLADVQAIVDAGPDAFTDDAIGTLLGGASGFIEALRMGECLSPASAASSPA